MHVREVSRRFADLGSRWSPFRRAPHAIFPQTPHIPSCLLPPFPTSLFFLSFPVPSSLPACSPFFSQTDSCKVSQITIFSAQVPPMAFYHFSIKSKVLIRAYDPALRAHFYHSAPLSFFIRITGLLMFLKNTK